MKISVVQGNELRAPELEAWRKIQAMDPELDSPFLCPEFTCIAAAARSDIEVAILEADGQQGFFPFQRLPHGRGLPVASDINDLQGLIAPRGLSVSHRQLLSAGSLVNWTFGRLLASQEPFRQCHVARHDSAIMDLSGGFAGYMSRKKSAGVTHRKISYLRKRMEREVGHVRFEMQSLDASVISTLIRWKWQLYRDRGYSDIYGDPWIRRVLDEVHATRTPTFGGILSTLHAGDDLVAGHLGLRSTTTLHHWIPAYDVQFARYSPGMVLMVEIARHAASLGIRRVELGGFDAYPYKRRLMTHSIELARGVAHRIPGVAASARARLAAEAWIRGSSMYPAARMVARGLRELRRSVA